MIKILFMAGIIGHLICFICDLLLIYSPSGKFNFKIFNDNNKMAAVFEKMPSKNPLISMLLGVLALTIMLGGYVGLGMWMGQFSKECQISLFIMTAICFIPMTAHHVFCGVAEWFYIELDRTENARQIVFDFFKKTAVTMYASYLGLIVFWGIIFVAVVTGTTTLPNWMCIINVIPVAIMMVLLKVPGTLNLASAIVYLCLLFFIP